MIKQYNKLANALLESGADVDCKDNQGKTALIYAVENENVELIDTLIEVGADINSQDESGKTAMHYASKNDNVETVQRLFKAGADILIKDTQEKTALENCNIKDEFLKNNLELIIEYSKDGNINGLKELIKLGVDVNQSVKEEVALEVALKNGKTEIVENLIENKAIIKFNLKEHMKLKKYMPEYARNEQEKSLILPYVNAVCKYIEQRDWKNAKEIIKGNKDVLGYFNKEGMSVLHVAVINATDAIDLEGIEYLLKENKGLINERSLLISEKQRKTPLHYAVEKGALEIVRILLKYVEGNEILFDK